MATLSKHLRAKGIKLVNPVANINKKIAQLKEAGAILDSESEASDRDVSFDISVDTENTEDTDNTTRTSSTPPFTPPSKMPSSSSKKKTTTSSILRSPSDLARRISSLSINGYMQSDLTMAGGLSCPMISGRWTDFDHMTD